MFNCEEYKSFLKTISDIKLTDTEKEKLKKIGKDKELTDKILLKIKNQILNKIITGEINVDYAKGAIYTIGYIRGLLK